MVKCAAHASNEAKAALMLAYGVDFRAMSDFLRRRLLDL
jgi:hypothetical protein